jgi:hypothetical protein
VACFILLLSLLLAFNSWLPARAAVTIAYFRALPGDASVLIEWGTQTEIDNVGFYINRGLQESGPFEQVSSFVFSIGDGLTGDEYSFKDDAVQNGTTYYYQLEAVDANNASEFHGPVSAIPGQATPTVTETPDTTLTPTTTSSPTATTASQGPYPAAPTNTPRPAYPGPATNTPRATTTAQSATTTPTSQAYPGPLTATVAPTATAPPTATFIPFNSAADSTIVPMPSVTIEFPDATSVAALSMISRSPDSGEMTKQGPSPPGRSLSSLLPLAFIALIWIILGAWFYFSMRQMQ